MKKCNVCNKELEVVLPDGTTQSCIGMQISVNLNSEIPSIQAFYKKQLGKYKLDKEYNICFECLLKSLKIKP